MALCRTNRALAVAALTGTLPLLGCSTVFDVPLPQAYTEACGEAEVAENTATPILRTDRQRFWTDGNIQSIETVAGGLAVVTARAVYLVPSEAGEVTASESSAWTVCQPDSPRCVIQGAWAFGGPRDWQREYLVGYPERVAVLSCDPDDSPHVAAAGEERAPCALRIRDVRRLSSRIEWGPETAARSEYLTAAAPARHGFVVGAVGVPGLVDGGGRRLFPRRGP